jgi:TRAP-type C4-dicarboxylate transport system permease small subunit
MASILDQVTKVSYNLSGLAMASMLCLIINEVVMRYFFNAPTTWSSDANQWLFALTVMLALPEITRVNGNVAITIVLEKMPQSRREILARILALVSCLACLLAFYIAGVETLRQLNNGITTTWVRPIPKWWISVVIPFGFLLSSIQFLRLGLKPKQQIEE